MPQLLSPRSAGAPEALLLVLSVTVGRTEGTSAPLHTSSRLCSPVS